MIRTLVCEKEGCSGNSFYLENKDDRLFLTCKECGSVYNMDVSYYEFVILPQCSHCVNDSFKVFKDIEKEGLYLKCVECGSPPEIVYLDEDGVQISYEIKLLNNIKDKVVSLEEKISFLEKKLDELEGGQELIEESLAYVSKFLSDIK